MSQGNDLESDAQSGRKGGRQPNPRARAGGILVGPISLDFSLFTVRALDRLVDVTPLEFDILAHLMLNTNRVVSHEEIVRVLCGGSYCHQTSLVRVHVAHLRRKLGALRGLIKTVRGRGFRFTTDPADTD
jgi:DNA-binding response OmpR family regulator